MSVVLAVGEAMLCSGLALVLTAEPDLVVVAEAGDGFRALRLATELSPLVVVAAVGLPGLNGVELARRLSAVPTPPAVLLLAGQMPDGDLGAVLRSGASGLLLTSAAPRLLGEAVRAVADGGFWLDPPVARRVVLDLVRRGAPTGEGRALVEQLTPREREILTLLAHGLASGAIARRLVISEATVKTHVARILGKLGVHERFQAVATAYRSGLVVPNQPLQSPHRT